jgi:prepilin-type N-terminal cleavage/methylation domain-containing protein
MRTLVARLAAMQTRRSRTRLQQRGLTLVELIVVITLIGLLSAAIAWG